MAEPLKKTPAEARYTLEEQIGFKLRLANQKHLEIFNRQMPDITPTQFAVLAKLRDEICISQNHLGRLVGMDAATTKGVVDRLRSLTAEAVVTAQQISAETVNNLTPREVDRLLALLEKL